MFKKIRSNINPDVTVTGELRKEFGKYFDKAEEKTNSFFVAYPKQIFIGMLVIIVISAIICFLVLTPERQKKKMPDVFKETTSVTNNVTSGLGDIVELGTKVNDIYKLKKQMEQIIAKDKLTKSDSLFLEKAILVLNNSSNLIREKQ